MGKKCIPGVICIENMTLFLLFILIVLVIYFIYGHSFQKYEPKIVVIPSGAYPHQSNPSPVINVSTRSVDSINDPYAPPLKQNAYFTNSSDVRGIPINIETRGTGMSYQQIGILTPMNNASGDLILPLMGRKLMNGRDKWQYYTMANGSSTLHTKLPVSINGRSCTGEYGCNDIQNGDTVYVQGYNNIFTATVYENSAFSYIPYI
jgi:hypothetical protein